MDEDFEPPEVAYSEERPLTSNLQIAHGRRQQELGTGIWVRRNDDLSTAVAAVLDPANGYAERARAFSEQISQEDGTARAITELEHILNPTS